MHMYAGEDPRYVKVMATCKHLAAYSVEDTPPDRHHFDASVSIQDLMDTYLPSRATAFIDLST